MKQKIVFCFLFFAYFFQNSTVQAQGWEKTFTAPLGDTTFAYSAVETLDSGFVFAGSSASLLNGSHPFVVKTDKHGKILWTYNPIDLTLFDTTKILRTIDNGFMILGTTSDRSTGVSLASILAIKLNSNGNEISRKSYLPGASFRDADITPELDRIVITTYQSYTDRQSNTVLGANLLQLTANNDSISNRYFSNVVLESVAFGGDRQIYTSRRRFYIPNLNDEYGIIKFNLNGDSLWFKQLYFDNFLERANDGKILVNSHIKFDYNGKVVFNGNPNPSDPYYTNQINIPFNCEVFTENQKDKNIYAIYDIYPLPVSSSNPKNLYFLKKDSIGRKILSFQLINNGISTTGIKDKLFSDIIATSEGGFLLVGRTEEYSGKARLIKLGGGETLKGKIHIDSIQNCRQDVSENGLPNTLISVAKSTETRWVVTDSIGNYEVQIDTGNYIIKGVLPNANWRFCTPSVSKQFLTFGTDTVNFAAQAAFNCPQMRISTSTNGLRRCFDNNYYTIRYTNEGTQAAQNAYITLKLDSLLEYISATRPLSSRQGQNLRFDLGTVLIGFEGQFSIRVRVKCGDSTRLGQSLCTEARIFPDTICIPAPNWSGANIVVSGRCDRDSVRFLIQNTGTAMSAPLRRKIVEDEIVFLNGLISVPANGSQTISVPANGKTWQLLMEQEPNNPLSNHPTAVVEGCRTSPNIPISTGFVNQFPTDDGSPTIDNVCSPIIGSYDPNDKEGLPLGYKTAHFIDQNQDIEYRIRFQNTGTDTAFTIVVRDTLSDFLDIASLKIGASSHRFNWTIDGKNVLVFRFENILLPDSFRNEAASHGFVKFKISQKKDVALGTKINNQADIYFDFNAPIRTNKTVHTIGKDFIITALKTISPLPNVTIKVYPNPFNAEATIEIQGFDPLSTKSNFVLFDALGRQIRHEKFDTNQFLFERRDLPTGIYFFKIENGGRLVGTGKFLVK